MGGPATSRRLPFHFQSHGSVGRLVLGELTVGPVTVDRLELEVSELGTDPGVAVAERFQRRRTRLHGLALRITQPAIDERVGQLRTRLAGFGITQLQARLDDGYVAVRARAADGLASAEISFHIQLVSTGEQLRALASAIRVHGHLPAPGPVIADRLLVALLGAGEAAGAERPYARGLCDVELDLVGAVLWQVLPPSGWRLPAVSEIELVHIRVARAAIEIVYGPAGTRGGALGVRPDAQKLAAAHDLMHSADAQLRGGHLEEAMRGYRALLVSSGPDQPVVLERILALAGARPGWFFDGLELARQALGRWPTFAAAHAALAAITLAQGDAREAAKHLEAVARLASSEGDDDQAALAALAAARLLRVLDPRLATELYELALKHDPGSGEAADSLADRLADEQRWPEFVRLVRARAAVAADAVRAVQLHLRLAEVFVEQLGDPSGAQHELAAARALAPDDPAVHEMTATILAASDPAGAIAAWREVARLAELHGNHRTGARAHARLGDLLGDAARAGGDDAPGTAAEDAWRRSLELDPLQATALVGLAGAAAARNDHAVAADLYERLRGLGLAQPIAARHELALARSLVALGRPDEARTSLRRATLAGGETAAEAHATLAEIADAAFDRDHAAAELDTAIAVLVELAGGNPDGDRLYARAAELAVARAMLFDKTRQAVAADADWQRAHALARQVAPEIARDAARTLLARAGHDAGLERRWIDAVLATRPPQAERAALLVRRADVRRRERAPDLAAALADLHEAVELTEEAEGTASHADTRRRAYQLEAQLFAQSGDQRSRAQALAAIAKLAERAADRVASETAAAAAWLAADEPAAALPHGARAHASLSALAAGTEIPAALRREVLVTLGEAAWRQRAWPDVVRAYGGLLEDPGADAPKLATFRYRLAVAADRAGDQAIALAALRPLIDDPDATRGASPELRGQALRLFADLAERADELVAAATALESFALIGGDGSVPARADAVYHAGELFRRAGHGDDAIRCFETALRVFDAHLPALDALEAAWRDRGDLERVAVILGRKVAATARHPSRQRPLLSRLGDLQDQLGRPEIARATHQRALEIDPRWPPSLRYITLRLRDAGQVVAAAGGLAQLAGELHGEHGVDLAIVTRERQIAAEALAELVARLDDLQLEAVRAVALPALERAALDNADVAAGLARLRGELSAPTQASPHGEDATSSGRIASTASASKSLRDAAARAREAGKLDDAFATLETANHVSPGDPALVRELVELAGELRDHAAAARHLGDLASQLAGARRGDALLELADIYYDKLDDAVRGRDAMRKAADAFGSGARRDATVRMLATEAATHLAWDIAVDSLLAVPLEKRTPADLTSLATALTRAGRDVDALAAVEAAIAAKRFDDGGELLRVLQREIQRKTDLARSLEDRATVASPDDAIALLEEAQQLRIAIGQPGTQPLRDLAAPASDGSKVDTAPWPLRTKTKPGLPNRGVVPAPATRPPPLGNASSSNPSIGIVEPVEPIDDDDHDDDIIAIDEASETSSGVPNAALELHPRIDPPPEPPLELWRPDDADPLPALPIEYATERPTAYATDVSTAHATDLSTAHATDLSTAHTTEVSTAHATDLSSAHTTDLSTDLSTAPATDLSTAHAADPSTAHATDLSTAHATDVSTAHATEPPTDLSTAHATDLSTAHAADPSTARATDLPTANATDLSTAHAANLSTAHAANLSTAHATDLSTAHAADLSTAHATEPQTDLSTAHTTEPPTGRPTEAATDETANRPAHDDPGAGGRRAVPTAVGHSTSTQMSAVDDPEAAQRPREAFAQPTLGRIKLVRSPPRPGVGQRERSSFAEDEDSGWQSVSNPTLTSGPAGTRAIAEPRTSAPTRPGATAPSARSPAPPTPASAEAVEPPSDLAIPRSPEPTRTSSPTMPGAIAQPGRLPAPTQAIAALLAQSTELTTRGRQGTDDLEIPRERSDAARFATATVQGGPYDRYTEHDAPRESGAERSAAPTVQGGPDAERSATPTVQGGPDAERSATPTVQGGPDAPAVDADRALDAMRSSKPTRSSGPTTPGHAFAAARLPAITMLRAASDDDPSSDLAIPHEPPDAARSIAPAQARGDASAGAAGDAMAAPSGDASGDTIDGWGDAPGNAMADPSVDASGDAPGDPMARPSGDASGDAPRGAMPRASGDAPGDAMARPSGDVSGDAMARPSGDSPRGAMPTASGDRSGDAPRGAMPRASGDAPANAMARPSGDAPGDAMARPSTAMAPEAFDAARAAELGATDLPEAVGGDVDLRATDPEMVAPSVIIAGTPEEQELALRLAAASADRDRLLAARRREPGDPALLLALLAHLGDGEPALRREVLEEVARDGQGRALAIALHELAAVARDQCEAMRAQALWQRAHEADPGYAPVWMPLADALAASDDTHAARELYDLVARSRDYDPARRAFAADRAEALGRDDSVVSGEIAPIRTDLNDLSDLEEARLLADSEDWPGALDAAERAAAARPDDPAALEVLEQIYLASGNLTSASEAVGRQLMLTDEPARRAALWRRRARMYRAALGRDAEAYRCLKEAHACSPADPEIAHQLRTAAMVRGDWQLAASLMYREIAASANPRDRGALHLELAMIYEEKLEDHAQAQTNYEQALAFDPTIPAIKLPLARRYEAIGRTSDAARLYEEAAATARAADRASLLEAAARCRATAAEAAEPDLAAQLDRAEAAGDLDAALELAHQLWRSDPGHPAAFRMLANVHRTSGDLAALTELTGTRASRAETPEERATAWLEVARLAEEIGALDQAARSYDLALIEDPGHVSALDARGALAYRLSDYATADLIYRDLGIGESVLGDDELALRRSIISEQLGRDSESLQLAQTAASLAPGRRDVVMRVQELATRIGELPIALAAARQVIELVPLDDDEGQLACQFALVELLRESGQLDEAVAQLEKLLRDHPMHAAALESLAQVHIARGDWPTATRYLYQLVPLAPSPGHRAERLYQLGEAVLLHVKDIDRADDVFLRASDLDPGHVPTLRRLLDVYWRADDPGGIVEVATELADKGALISGPTSELALARALVAAALVGDTQLAQRIQSALGEDTPGELANALSELAGRSGRLQLSTASTAIVELARRGLLDLAKLRAAIAGTPAANVL